MGTGRLIGRSFWGFVCSDGFVRRGKWGDEEEEEAMEYGVGDTVAFGSSWGVRMHSECLRVIEMVQSAP